MYTGRRGSEDSRDIDDGQMDLLEAFISTKQLDKWRGFSHQARRFQSSGYAR
jgi:hypothetical protein